jgi:predicted dehydrogenase
MSKISISIIGAGKISIENEFDNYRKKPASHLGAYLKYHKIFDVKGIYDVNKNKCRKYSKIFKVNSFETLDELLASNSDILVLAINYKNNLKVIKHICKSKYKPKIIFCEKPISNKISSANQIYNLCKKNKIKLLINNRRLENKYIFAKNLIDKFKKDKIIHVSAKSSSGLHSIGIHMIDLLNFYVGKIKNINNVVLNDKIKKLKYSNNFFKKDPRVLGYFQFYKNNATCSYISTARTNFSFFEIEIFFNNFKMIINQNDNFIEIVKMSNNLKSTLSYQLSKSKKYYINNDNTLFDNIANELNKVFENKKLKSFLDAEYGLEAYRILDKLSNARKIKN